MAKKERLGLGKSKQSDLDLIKATLFARRVSGIYPTKGNAVDRFKGLISGFKEQPSWKERIPVIGQQFFKERMIRQFKRQQELTDFINYEYPLLTEKEQMGIRSFMNKKK